MAAQDLARLDQVKGWANVTSSDSDLLIARLITQASRFICQQTRRPSFLPTPFSETFDGARPCNDRSARWPVLTDQLILRYGPVLSVTSLLDAGAAIAAAATITVDNPSPAGYVLDPWDGTVPGNAQFLSLRGQWFKSGLRNVVVNYIAGYQVRGEAATIPASGLATIAADQPLGRWGSDGGVTFADGTPLTKVAGSPATGQYAIDAGKAVYSFAAADAGEDVLLTYGFVPADIEHACIEMVGERLAYMARIGVLSKALGGQETVSFNVKSVPDYIADVLAGYRVMALA